VFTLDIKIINWLRNSRKLYSTSRKWRRRDAAILSAAAAAARQSVMAGGGGAHV